MSTILNEFLPALQDIIVDDVRAGFFKSLLTKNIPEAIPFEGELQIEPENEILTILELLVKCRFEFDLNFVTTEVELQNFFNQHIREDDSTLKIRTVMNWINTFYIKVGTENWLSIIDELCDVYSLNSKLQIDPTLSCYDEFILNGGMVFDQKDNYNIFSNNPWLVIVGLIKFIPATVIISLTQPETMDKWT